MKQPMTARPHGGVRGANLSRASLLFGGPFGKIFRSLPPADFGANDDASKKNLDELAVEMVRGEDKPKDGPDNEESGIPAAFTYFGQFVDHDLTFDPASSLQKQNDPDALVDYRTPRFDMDNIYGRGPDDQPYMFDGKLFILGEPFDGASTNPNAKHLPRAANGRAIIGDPRNDENVLVSQLQSMWHRFHNHIARENESWPFERIQQEVRFHYQWIVLHDFMTKIVADTVLKEILPDGMENLFKSPPRLRIFHAKDEAFMPLEFSAAAYRFGHSMVRPGYRLNDTIKDIPIFAMGKPGGDLRGFLPPPAGWAMDWQRFINLEPLDYGVVGVGAADPDQTLPANQKRLQLAYVIDTSLTNPLKHLPKSIDGGSVPNLAQRNLERGWRMRLPSGQSIARALGIDPLADKDILIGKFPDGASRKAITEFGDGKFKDNCPLWTYCLAEATVGDNVAQLTVETKEGAKVIATPQLGAVGGRIVAETFLGLMVVDSSSYISQNPTWQPSFKHKGVFGLREMIKVALES